MTRAKGMFYWLAVLSVVMWLLIACYVGIWGGVLW